MVYRGRVTNGVVVLEDDVRLPEGTPVTVQPVEKPIAPLQDDPIYGMAELAVPTGIADLAVNIDHYLYGHPKVDDA